MVKRNHYKAWDPRHKHIPMTKTDYVRKGSKWVKVNSEKSIISNQQASWVLSKTGLPCERSHRLEKRNRYGHSRSYDTFSSISPDGRNKSTWYVDFAQGDKNYHKLLDKRYYDQKRYKKRKQMRSV